ncbi:MAG: DUF4266 domain-containing protein [Verrucomicrobiaceae bacterium]|jgi:hypothetical protein
MNTVRLLLLVVLSLVLCQCTQVMPWQRGKLADYTMRPDRDVLALALNEHLFFSREAASGGRGIGGGGCGCN